MAVFIIDLRCIHCGATSAILTYSMFPSAFQLRLIPNVKGQNNGSKTSLVAAENKTISGKIGCHRWSRCAGNCVARGTPWGLPIWLGLDRFQWWRKQNNHNKHFQRDYHS